MKVVSTIKSRFLSMLPPITSSFLTYLFSSILNLLVSYSIMMLLLKLLPKSQYGVYGLYVSFFSMLLIFLNFGHKEAVFKFSSQLPTTLHLPKLLGIFRTFFWWNLLLLLIVQGLILFDLVLYVGTMVALVNNWLFTAGAYYRGQSNYKRDALIFPIQRALWLLACLLIYWLLPTFELFDVFIAALVASCMSLVWVVVPLFNQYKHVISQRQNSRHFSLLRNFLIIEISSVFYLKSDVLLLYFFDINLLHVADYFFSVQLFDIIVLVIMPIGYFYFNGLSKTDSTSNNLSIKKHLLSMIGLIVIAHLSIFLLAPIIFPLIIPKYTSSIDALSLIIFSLYPVAANILLSSQLIFKNKEVVYAKICFIALAFNVIFNVLLIPLYKVHGVLLVKFLTEVIITLLLVKSINRNKFNSRTK